MSTPIHWLCCHFATTLKEWSGSLPIWNTPLWPSFNWCLEMLLQYIHVIFLPHDAIYFMKCTSPSCSKAPPQHDAAISMLHGWDSSACKPPPFPPNITMVIMANSCTFVSSDQRTFLQKVQSSSPCAVAKCSLSFLWWFWSSGFFLLSCLSGYVDIGHILLWL